eukprot:1732984-Rhodomonas_salina.6
MKVVFKKGPYENSSGLVFVNTQVSCCPLSYSAPAVTLEAKMSRCIPVFWLQKTSWETKVGGWFTGNTLTVKLRTAALSSPSGAPANCITPPLSRIPACSSAVPICFGVGFTRRVPAAVM